MIITTSKRPSGRTRTFARELVSAMPNAVYLQRGKKNIEAMAEEAYYGGHERLCIIQTKDGNPAGFEFMDTETKEYIGGMAFTVTLRREMSKEKVKPPSEYTEFFIATEEKEAFLLSQLFLSPLQDEREKASCFAAFKENILDFFRLDIDEGPLGPRLFVRNIRGKDYNKHQD